jgi:hypothetical protein
LSQEKEQKTTQTLGKGLLIILWITAIFMVMIMNDIKENLEQINSKLQSVVRSSYANNPTRLQVVDAKDGKTVIYLIQQVPDLEGDQMIDEPGETESTPKAPSTKPAE